MMIAELARLVREGKVNTDLTQKGPERGLFRYTRMPFFDILLYIGRTRPLKPKLELFRKAIDVRTGKRYD